MSSEQVKLLAERLLKANYAVALTGAGISVESGIPPFRGENGIWNQIDPRFVEINYFLNHYQESWKLIKDIFLEKIARVSPNIAHFALAELEKKRILKSIITQNIDGLHQKAGSVNVIDFHGTTGNGICLQCSKIYKMQDLTDSAFPPYCKKCGGKVKPDFIFFSEPIPEPIIKKSFLEAMKADLLLIIGTSGEVAPANQIAYQAAANNAFIAEINLFPSHYSSSIATLFIQEKATVVARQLLKELNLQVLQNVV